MSRKLNCRVHLDCLWSKDGLGFFDKPQLGGKCKFEVFQIVDAQLEHRDEDIRDHRIQDNLDHLDNSYEICLFQCSMNSENSPWIYFW